MRTKILFALLLVMVIILIITIYYPKRRVDYIAFGDSITWYDGNLLSDETRCIGYQQIVARELGFSYRTEGYAGRPMAHGTIYDDPLVDAICNENFARIKICTIAIGTNDLTLNVPIGELTDGEHDINTFIGSYQIAVEHIISSNQNTQIILITPIHRENGDEPNDNGNSLVDYVNAVKQLGDYYNISVCDMYNGSGITMENINEYTIDGLHPNNEGHRIMGEFLANFIESM